jgi:5'-methylthioadenosine phosphorylase
MEKIGVIGGSGLYELDGLTIKERVDMDTPFGKPSAPLVVAELEGHEVVFLPRHGIGHRFSPSEIPYRANIYAMKKLGVTQILSVSAVGSMKEEIEPGHIVFPDQFFDRTLNRARTFFENGVVAHIAFGEPICAEFQAQAIDAAKKVDVKTHIGGAYVCIEGPQFSTRAESNVFRSWGVTVIGMTNLPEARLAREAEISYATMALATDYDCWHEGHDDVTVENVIATLKLNVANAKSVIRELVLAHDPNKARQSPAKDALNHAVMTAPDAIPAEAKERLGLFLNKYWKKD